MAPRALDDGLLEDELASIEAIYGFRFPVDLRALLREGPPPPPPETWDWLDWRGDRTAIAALQREPVEIVAAHLADSYWLPQWGERPAALDERLRLLANAPVLIPLRGQHYMAAEPSDAGNPVFSIFNGIDIIVMGCDLADYLAGGPRAAATKGAARHIRFWSDIVYTPWSEPPDRLAELFRPLLKDK